jgi:hypothetical protein
MVEGRVVRALISQDFGGLWNPVRRLVGTDTSAAPTTQTPHLT